MSQVKQVSKWKEMWNNFLGVISAIGVIFSIFSYYNGSVTVSSLDLCNGFLVNDPPVYVLKETLPSKQEKEYLESKINCYRDQIQKNLNDVQAYTNIGEAERRLGNLEGARKAHQKALKLKPGLPEAKIGLALVEQDMGNKMAANQGIQDVLAKHPTNALALFYQVTTLYAQNKLKDAEVALKKVKELEPKLLNIVKTWNLPNIRIPLTIEEKREKPY